MAGGLQRCFGLAFFLVSRPQPDLQAAADGLGVLRSVATDGECRRLPPPASSRATAGVLVPIRAATSACVNPACRRALSNSSSKANSSAWASYSALTAGCLSIFLTNALCVIIRLHLFHPCRRDAR